MPGVYSWLRAWRTDELHGTLVGIFIADQAGQAMRSMSEIEAITGIGLAGDRYAKGQGHWRQTDACQVTLVSAEELLRAERRSGLSFSAGEHRRNLVVHGIPIDAFRNRQVRIGKGLFKFHRLRPPCGYLDRLLVPGAGKALGKGAGIGLSVLKGGLLQVGDGVSVITD